MLRACRKAVALFVCSAVLAGSSMESVVAQQNACASNSASMNVCGRIYNWRAVPGGLYVLRCPATSQGLQGGSVMMGSYGPNSDPDWRLCGSYDGVDSCEVGSNSIWFHRGGPDGPQLKSNTALTLSGRHAAVQFPFCQPQFSPACAACSASISVQFVFEDAAGFQSAPSATAESLAPTCSADGASVVGQQSIRLKIHLDAPAQDDPAAVYAGNLNLDGNTGMQGTEVSSGNKLTNFRTGTWQGNSGSMNVLLVDQAGAGTIATVEDVAFDANGDAQLTVALPPEYSSRGAANLNLNVVLRSRSTGIMSAFSTAVPVTLQACIPPPVVSTPEPTPEPTPTTPPTTTTPSLPESGGQELGSTGELVAVPEPDTTTPTGTTAPDTTTAPDNTTPSTGTPSTTTASSDNSGSGSTTSTPPATTTPSNPSQGSNNGGGSNAQDGDVNVGASGAASSPLSGSSAIAVALATAASAALMLLA